MYSRIRFTAEMFSGFLWFMFWLPSEDTENDGSLCYGKDVSKFFLKKERRKKKTSALSIFSELL